MINITSMKSQIEYLKSKPEISTVLAEGFAQIYHQKPQFPITFLAHFLKNHNQLQTQKKKLVRKLINNQTIRGELKKEQSDKLQQNQEKQEKLKKNIERHEGFQFKIKECVYHDEFLNQYCEWIEQEKKFTGVYIGELEHQFKNIHLDKEDGEEAHIDNENPKIIKFKAASHSHNALIIGKTLTQESIVGKLLTEKPEEPGGEEEQGKKQTKTKGEIYIPLVQQNKELHYFKYPRLGAFFAIVLQMKSYLHQKIFDSNLIKSETYRKAKEEYDKESEERQNKFRQLYDERSASGADEKELEQLELNFQKDEENYPKPKLQDYEFIQRDFVVCFDTLGLDRQITEEERDYCRHITQFLKQNWQNKQKELLQKDIDSQLKQNAEHTESPFQEVFTRLVEEEDKELPTHQQPEKVKTNQKLFELQINTLRIQKIKEYIQEDKYLPFLDSLLQKRVMKYSEIMKIFYLFGGLKKENINYKGTNIMNWYKAKGLLSREQIISKINQFVSRGSKPSLQIESYAKWQRILKALEKYDQNTVAAYNIYLAFILRFLQLSGKVRLADNEARKAAAKAERQAREEKIKQAELKVKERDQKLQLAKAEAQGKEQGFDEQNWLRTYEEQNPPIEIGEEVIEQKDEDLQQQNIEPAI